MESLLEVHRGLKQSNTHQQVSLSSMFFNTTGQVSLVYSSNVCYNNIKMNYFGIQKHGLCVTCRRSIRFEHLLMSPDSNRLSGHQYQPTQVAIIA